ncbi:hypothetical protein JYU34_018345 [Plutella xylostella]|uniref:alanine--tRNA ligase n=1 Tax=Plutella xylostella TaxID=51655 RepID=A0ABQ7PY22_PLUXY|nr:hypothetical protein JYU34_018345 [Plutella xylostella]
MFRIPVRSKTISSASTRLYTSSSFIRSTFIDYFKDSHGHKFVKSSSVVPLCDPTVPFVNAGMNQFKGIFLDQVQPPCPRAVNSQKCIRVGGKHNDLDVVGTDGHHHTFFEMLGNWSFGDYYKKEACQMAWDLLLGPYRLKPEHLVVTYFGGDPALGLPEDRECRDIWKGIGVQSDRLKPLGAQDNFWEMGLVGPCGPCTEIHHVNPDGTLTEIWNLVFIQFNREADGSLRPLRTRHVDTGLGLERAASLLQRAPDNYRSDLLAPLIAAVQLNAKDVDPYAGRYGADAALCTAYRRLADHARMIAVCLADGAFPATSLNLKQILRKSLRISSDVFKCPSMLPRLYDVVAETLGPTYPELVSKRKDAHLILQYEEESFKKLRSSLAKKWKDLAKAYPEVESLSDIELTGFANGYKEFKETVAKLNSTVIPGELVFKLYDTHGFQEDHIDRIAQLNNLQVDKEKFKQLLAQHRSRHKTSFKEQADSKAAMFEQAIDKIKENGVEKTNDQYKYDYTVEDRKLIVEPLKTNLVAFLNEDGNWVDNTQPCENKHYYLVTKDTNFYCEEGGQIADTGTIIVNENTVLNVEAVFKIKDFVFHKGTFQLTSSENNTVKCGSEVKLLLDTKRRLNIMRNHTGVHLLNAAIRKALPNSVVCPIGSKVTDKGCTLNLSVYGEKLSQKAVLDAQELVRQTITSNVPITTSIVDSINVSDVTTVPGETYPDAGLRVLEASGPGLLSRELCCGTHAPSTGVLEEFCITLVKGAGSHTPAVHAITGDAAKEARELFIRADKIRHVTELISPTRMKEEADSIRRRLASLCGTAGAPHASYRMCLDTLDRLEKETRDNGEVSLDAIAEAELLELESQLASTGRRFIVHFLRAAYLCAAGPVAAARRARCPALLLACAGGDLAAAANVPKSMVTPQFTAAKWLSCVLPVFESRLRPPGPGDHTDTYAEMEPKRVSLIHCEQQVQDAMRAAIRYAQAHAHSSRSEPGERTPARTAGDRRTY